MAILTMPFITLILRTKVEQEISAAGWKWLFNRCDPSQNYDGEIMVFGSMNFLDVTRNIEDLVSFGFIGPDKGEASDMVVWEGPFGATTYQPDWLSLVEVEFFDDTSTKANAWKLTKSGVYELVDFHSDRSLPTKGYDCDWAPKIGKIG